MTTESSQTKTIARSAGTVGTAVFVSRIFGLIREQVFAVLFGAGYAYDAFVVAYRIPNLLRDLFAEGALSSAFVAVFTDYKTKKGRDATWELANKVITSAFLIIGSITILGAFFSSDIVSAITDSDFSLVPGKHELTALMTSIMFPFLVLVSLSAVVMGILNTMGKFFVPAIASSFFNLGSIISGVSLSLIVPKFGLHPIVGMAFGVMIGGLLQLAVQIPSLKKQGMRFRPHVNFSDPGLLRIMKLMVPAIIGLSATQINMFINTFFASGCAEGSLSWLQFAFRVLMFPIGLVGVSLSIATMPVISRHASTGDIPKLKEAYVSSTVLSFVLSVPATFGLIFLSQPIIRVIFEHGNFTASDTLLTANALTLYAIGLFAYSALKIIVPVFYALDKTKYPVIGSFITIFLNISIVLTTIKTLHYKAIPLSVSLCVITNFLILSFMLYREVKGYEVRHLIQCLIKIIPVSLIMGAGAYWINGWCENMLAGKPFENLIPLLVAIGFGVVFYGAVISMMDIKEVTPIKNKIISKLSGKRI
jgi:putative peptidoglycan lipid II flippase